MPTANLALISSALGRLLRTRPAWANRLRWLTGSVLIGLGVRLAVPESRSRFRPLRC